MVKRQNWRNVCHLNNSKDGWMLCGVPRLVSAAPDSERAVQSGSRLCPACSICSKPWHQSRFSSFDEHAHQTNGLLPFQCFTINPQHQSVRQSVNPLCIVACVLGDLAAGLRQYVIGWPACMPAGQASICAERCSTPDLQIQEIRPRNSAAVHSPLVESTRTHHISASGAFIPMPERTRTTISYRWPSPGLGHRFTATSPFSVNHSAHRLSFSAACDGWSRVLRRCSSGVQQPPALCDIFVVPHSLQAPSQDWTF